MWNYGHTCLHDIESEEDFKKHVDEHETKVKAVEDKYHQKLSEANVSQPHEDMG